VNEEIPGWVERVLSPPRFAPYLVAAGGDIDSAVALYRWNVEAAAAFVVPLHWVETAARNRMHAQLVEHFGQEHWWDTAPLDGDGLRKVADARGTLRRQRRNAVADSIVAELNFGFWVSLVASRYHRTLWVPALTKVFPGRSRRDVHVDYRHVLILRNRIMHHEPVHRRHLAADHLTLGRLIGELSPEALAEVAMHDQVPEVLSRRYKL
jgi:hypothetical protein